MSVAISFVTNAIVTEIVTEKDPSQIFRHNKFVTEIVTESPSQFQKEDMGLPGVIGDGLGNCDGFRHNFVTDSVTFCHKL